MRFALYVFTVVKIVHLYFAMSNCSISGFTLKLVVHDLTQVVDRKLRCQRLRNCPATLRMAPAKPVRLFARVPTVMQATGLGWSTIHRLVANGEFLAPIHVGTPCGRLALGRSRSLERFASDRHSLRRCGDTRRVEGGRSPAPANP